MRYPSGLQALLRGAEGRGEGNSWRKYVTLAARRSKTAHESRVSRESFPHLPYPSYLVLNVPQKLRLEQRPVHKVDLIAIISQNLRAIPSKRVINTQV